MGDHESHASIMPLSSVNLEKGHSGQTYRCLSWEKTVHKHFFRSTINFIVRSPSTW